jgi:hypothetical protein
MTLWAAVVAQGLGHHHDEALTLGRAVAGLNAHSKAKRRGLIGSEGSRRRSVVPVTTRTTRCHSSAARFP